MSKPRRTASRRGPPRLSLTIIFSGVRPSYKWLTSRHMTEGLPYPVRGDRSRTQSTVQQFLHSFVQPPCAKGSSHHTKGVSMNVERATSSLHHLLRSPQLHTLSTSWMSPCYSWRPLDAKEYFHSAWCSRVIFDVVKVSILCLWNWRRPHVVKVIQLFHDCSWKPPYEAESIPPEPKIREKYFFCNGYETMASRV